MTTGKPPQVYFYFDYGTCQMRRMGKYDNFLAAHATLQDPTQGIIYSADTLETMRTDKRFPGGIKLYNPKNHLSYRLAIKNGEFEVVPPGEPTPPSKPPMQYVGD